MPTYTTQHRRTIENPTLILWADVELLFRKKTAEAKNIFSKISSNLHFDDEGEIMQRTNRCKVATLS